jgi:hypothetical protein
MRFLHQYGYIRQIISKSRLSRRLSRLEPVAEDIFGVIAHTFTQIYAEKEFILDSTSLEVCDNIRIRRCRLLSGEEFRGYKASFRRYFYGLRLQLLTTKEGIPVDYILTEGSMHDNEGMKLMEFNLSAESIVYADAAYTDYHFEDSLKEGRLIDWQSQRKVNSKRPKTRQQQKTISKNRKRIETIFSMLKNRFKRKLQAYSIEGYMRKIKFFLLATQLNYLI